MSWTVRHTKYDRRGVSTRDIGDYSTREAAQRWLAANVEGSTRGYEVVERRVGA